ncbi:MAG: transcriptional regulator [Gammaproteobacteria bacterium]|nr:transcriptional regulator [Gammaproteobacteria bacterium]
MSDNPYHYTNCGLDYVYLKNGYTIYETEEGGGVAIEGADGLHAAIARAIVTAPHILRGQELRYLRSMLDISQSGLGEVLGVSRPTIARWEGLPQEPISASSDRTLRLFYALKELGHEQAEIICDLLREIDELEFGPSLFELEKDEEERWVPTPKAA